MSIETKSHKETLDDIARRVAHISKTVDAMFRLQLTAILGGLILAIVILLLTPNALF